MPDVITSWVAKYVNYMYITYIHTYLIHTNNILKKVSVKKFIPQVNQLTICHDTTRLII